MQKIINSAVETILVSGYIKKFVLTISLENNRCYDKMNVENENDSVILLWNHNYTHVPVICLILSCNTFYT